MRKVIVAVLAVVALFVSSTVRADNPPIGENAFQRLWDRQDRPVQEKWVDDRSWTWGPTVSEAMFEQLKQATDHKRKVQYFEKSRMEINYDPSVDPASEWYVTNGLLPIEMMEGRIQTGADFTTEFEQHVKADTIYPIGDQTEGNFPSYADLSVVYNDPGSMNPNEHKMGEPATAMFSSDGEVSVFKDFVEDTNTILVSVSPDLDNGYGIPQAFKDFMTKSGSVFVSGNLVQSQIYNPLFVFGKAVTAPYWTKSMVGGQEIPILFQVFERRVLTYNPANPAPFQVEMGNVGLQYYNWRYGGTQPNGGGTDPTPTPMVEATPTPMAEATPTPAPYPAP